MTSPLRLGFLYDPGISRFPHQTSAGSAGEHNSLSLPPSTRVSVSPQLHRTHSTHRSCTATSKQHRTSRTLRQEAPPTETDATRPERRPSNEEDLRLSTETRSDLRVFRPGFPAPEKLDRHDVRGAAIQRGQDERLRCGQRGQPDVL